MRALAVVLASLATAGLAAGAVPVRSVTAAAPITALAADGDLVAYASGRTSTDCDRITVWNRKTGRIVARLGRTTHCEETSTGSGIAAMSMAGRRVLWLHYTGGNIREWSLFTATTKSRAPRRIAFFERDVDDPPPVILGEGDVSKTGNQLPYAIGREVRVLSEAGSRQATWTESSPVTALVADGGLVTVATADGRVSSREWIDDFERPVSEATGRPAATAVFASAVQRGRRIETGAGADGSKVFTLPAGARLVGAEWFKAIYVAGGRATLLDLQNGARRDLGPASHARLEILSAIVARGRSVRAFRVG